MLRPKSVALAIAFLLPTIANATTWYVKPAATGTADCSSWANACASLATAKTKVASNDDEIWLMKGIYSISAEVASGTYALKIYGGFDGAETAVDFRNPAKNVVVLSADVDAADSSKVGGVTPSYANVLGTGTTRILSFINTGVLSTSPVNILDGVTLSGMNLKTTNYGGLLISNAKAEINNVKFVGNLGHAPGIYLTAAFTQATVTNTEFTNNKSIDDVASSNSEINEGGAIYVEGASASLTCQNCKFTGNVAAKTGGAIHVTNNGSLNIVESGFTSNESQLATGGGGALYSNSAGVVNIDSALFDTNKATLAKGGAIATIAGTLNINSGTFYGNTAPAAGMSGGAIDLSTGTTAVTIKYSTFYKNQAPNGGAINVNAAYAAPKPIINTSLILNNTATTGPNINGAAGFTDGGFNVIGYNNVSGVVGTWSHDASSKTSTETVLAKISDDVLQYNGGQHKSLRLAIGSADTINKIPNDLPLSSVGTTPSNPFTSIAQARAVMASYSSYDAGKYFFDLSGTTFATYVDKEGYVLVASSDSMSTGAAAYTQVSTLAKRTDSILNSSIMAKFDTTQIDEVRISSASDGVRGTFDGYSKDPDVITSLKNYSVLNNSVNGGAWTVKSSSKAVNYFTATTAPTAATLNNAIFHANGNASGLFWMPVSSNEALSSSTSVKDDLDLWVRSSKGFCNGTVAADQRGLPRSDYVNPNDPNQYGLITSCDIGAFEWNNGYQLDCWDEDGARPENSLSGGMASVCFSDLNSITPKALINNFGSTNWQALLMLGLLGLFRYRRKYTLQ